MADASAILEEEEEDGSDEMLGTYDTETDLVGRAGDAAGPPFLEEEIEEDVREEAEERMRLEEEEEEGELSEDPYHVASLHQHEYQPSPQPTPAPPPNHADYTFSDLEGAAEYAAVGYQHVAADDLLTESSDLDIRKLSVGERLYYIGCGMERNRQERLRKEREHKIVSELALVTAKPMITQKARNLPSTGVDFAEKSLLWSRRLERERKRNVAKKVMEDTAETLDRVPINPRSQALLRQGRLREKYQGPITGWNKHFAKYQTKRNQQPEKEVFTPNINSASALMQRDGSIGERLFEEATRKEMRLRDMINLASLKELVDEDTGLPYFTPRSRAGGTASSVGRSRSAEPQRDIDTVVSNLLSKGQETQKKKEQLACADKSAKYSFKPKLNARSQEMVAVKGRRPLYTPTKARQVQQHHHQQPQPQPHASTPRMRSPFKHEGDLPSYTCTQAFMRRNERLLLHRQERVNQIKREQEQKELAHCTFAPRICRQSEEILQHGQALSTGMGFRSKALPAGGGQAGGYSVSPRTGLAHAGGGGGGEAAGVRSPITVRATAAVPHSPAAPANFGASIDAGATGGATGGAGGGTDAAVSTFEREMLTVLEEWRKLEDV